MAKLIFIVSFFIICIAYQFYWSNADLFFKLQAIHILLNSLSFYLFVREQKINRVIAIIIMALSFDNLLDEFAFNPTLFTNKETIIAAITIFIIIISSHENLKRKIKSYIKARCYWLFFKSSVDLYRKNHKNNVINDR